MKSIFTIAALFVATCISSSSASAQANSLRASIPFNFTVGQTYLEAGTYTVTTSASSPIVHLSSQEKSLQVMSMGQRDWTGTRVGSKLVFHLYGNQYFLSEILRGGSEDVRFVPTKAEKQAKQQLQEAGIPLPDPILVAMN